MWGKKHAFRLPRPCLGATELLVPLPSSFHADHRAPRAGRGQSTEGGQTPARRSPPRQAPAGWARLPPVRTCKVAPSKLERSAKDPTTATWWSALQVRWWWTEERQLPHNCDQLTNTKFWATPSNSSPKWLGRRSNTILFAYMFCKCESICMRAHACVLYPLEDQGGIIPTNTVKIQNKYC